MSYDDKSLITLLWVSFTLNKKETCVVYVQFAYDPNLYIMGQFQKIFRNSCMESPVGGLLESITQLIDMQFPVDQLSAKIIDKLKPILGWYDRPL